MKNIKDCMRVLKYNTKVSIARPNSESGRTTIPKEVMNFLELSIGDNVDWIVEIDGEEFTVKFKKQEE
jgi:bifunctional DNA-binding transcriptional regulator/antitoxin component of YhaV-PrlF toxin-antitoxin module